MMRQTEPSKGVRIVKGLLAHVGVLLMASPLLRAQETAPIGKTPEDQRRNAVLLGDYDYGKYPTALTGYTGQDRQRVASVHWRHAVRTRVGPRGNYKAGLTQLPNGSLLAAVCRDNKKTEPTERYFDILVYASNDQGLTWKEVGKSPLYGKEPCLTTLPDDSILLTAQLGYFGPAENAPAWVKKGHMPVSRSEDGGKTWETVMIPGATYPRSVIVEPDGNLLMIREGKEPNLQLCRSKDGGRTWEFSEGLVDWNANTWYGEVSAIRLKSGRLLAALRRQIPGTHGEGFEDTYLTESTDGGEHWAKPWPLANPAEVHVYLTQLHDGRVLATYSNYHLPWGVYAIVSEDQGRSWDLDHPIQLALSADIYVGWPVTLQLQDNSLITSYAITAYLKEPPKTTATEVVRWNMPSL